VKIFSIVEVDGPPLRKSFSTSTYDDEKNPKICLLHSLS
jgi:hypothetical protein